MSEDLTAFVKYATAFEEGFAADDWSRVDVLFDDDIAWAVSGLPSPEAFMAQGRKNVSATIKRSVDTFDRRFDRRDPAPTRAAPRRVRARRPDRRDPAPTKGPVAIPGGIHLEWQVTYTREGLPPFVLLGEEWDLFRNGKLAMHYERLHNGTAAIDFIVRHHAALVAPR